MAINKLMFVVGLVYSKLKIMFKCKEHQVREYWEMFDKE